MNRLNLIGRRTGIPLQTMRQKKVVVGNIVSVIEVAGPDTDRFCELPDTFTQRSTPVYPGSIPRQGDLD